MCTIKNIDNSRSLTCLLIRDQCRQDIKDGIYCLDSSPLSENSSVPILCIYSPIVTTLNIELYETRKPPTTHIHTLNDLRYSMVNKVERDIRIKFLE